MTPISRSKVIRRSKSYDMLGQGQWSFPPSLVKICQVMTELQRDWQKKKERILQRQNKTACLPSCKNLTQLKYPTTKHSKDWVLWVTFFFLFFFCFFFCQQGSKWSGSLGQLPSKFCYGPQNVKTKSPKWPLKMLAHFNTWCVKDTRKNKYGPEKNWGLSILLSQVSPNAPWHFEHILTPVCWVVDHYCKKHENQDSLTI